MKAKTILNVFSLVAVFFSFNQFSLAQQDSLKTPITVSVEVIDPSCSSSADGQVNLTISGGFPPYYVNGILISGSNYTLAGLNQGDFQFFVSDDFLTNTTVMATITSPLELQITAVVNNVTTIGGNDGSIDLTVLSQSSVTYSWSVPGNPAITFTDALAEDQSGLVNGIYSVTITESNGCETIKRFIVSQPQAGTSDPSVPNFDPNTGSYQSGSAN